MTTPTKAVLLDVRAYQADNNIRRSVASFSVNYASTAEGLSTNSFLLAVNATKVLANDMNPSAMTLLRTSQPLTVTITFRNTSQLTLIVTRMMLLDSDISSLSILNPSSNTESAKVTLLQG